jgi:hypothetical protein
MKWCSHRSCRVVVLVLLLALSVGCSGDGDPSPAPDEPSDSETASSPAGDQLRTVEATRVRGEMPYQGFLQAGDGSFLVVFQRWVADRTQYRVYDRGWRPRTPLLEVDAYLDIDRGLEDGFIGLATRTKADGRRYAYRRWVTIGTDGRIEEVPNQPVRGQARQPVRPGDVRMSTAILAGHAYRPSTEEVFTVEIPEWRRSVGEWSNSYISESGSACVLESPRRADPVHTSLVEGDPWRTHDTEFIPVSDPSRRLSQCWIHPGRLVVSTTREHPTFVYTVDTDTGRVLSLHPLGGALNGYGLRTMPDGTLVVGTNRPGLMVGTDSTNREVAFRPWPPKGDPTGQEWTVVDETLIVPVGRRIAHVSTDRGNTWRTVDLQMP